MARHPSGSIIQLSASTYVLDTREKVRAYLDSIGHRERTIGSAVVFVRYENGKAAAVGPTRESVEPQTGEGTGGGIV